MRTLRFSSFLGLLLAFGVLASGAAGQGSPYKTSTFRGIALRNIGPALTSGRVADFAVNPNDPAEFYAATASGGVWKTVNDGTTWEPIFDGEGSYSIGVVQLDPNNPHVVWVGTGENNGQRSVSYGDGVYKSVDGGKTWKNMGLKDSQHIGRIVIDPRNSDVVYVAAQGPLWNAGGDRGLYKTTDGGKTWSKVLSISDNTGVSDVVMDPRDPDVLYASAWQRRRHVWTYLGGGPESALYKTTDAGKTWTKLTNGLPSGEVGRIGLCISPVDPDYVYAIMEAANDHGGFFRSTDRGGSWQKRNSYSTSGNYYSELVCDPVHRDRVYAMDVRLQVTNDGGATFEGLGEADKHVDNHALWIDPKHPDHYLNGNDGGVYETWDAAKSWEFKANLPVTQFYRVALDTDQPFYHVYGGTQDNYSLGGPARTTSANGITNADWFVTNGGDGFGAKVDPTDPNIIYAESQYGGLVRYDRKSGERVPIQPQPGEGEAGFRWNWDAPLLISPFDHTRIYFAANKVFQSDDRGDSWKEISGDLTRGIDRNKLPVMGRVWGMDAVAKNASTSIYGNIVALDESPVQEGLLYVGTDDGLIQVTQDGGAHWTRIDRFPGVPDRTYVSDVLASNSDANTVFAAFDNRKNGDFKPYLLKSTDNGAHWTSIASDLPENGSVHVVAQDPVDPDLLFAGTEFGVFFSHDGGGHWTQLKGHFPTIAVRDLAIQKQADDLVMATFGRGYWVLDDLAPLRDATPDVLAQSAHIFAPRDALIYIPSRRLGGSGQAFQGAAYYEADNPPFGADITYYLKSGIQTREQKRHAEEKKLRDAGEPVPYPSFAEMRAEDQEEAPYLLFTITDDQGNVVRRLRTNARAGMHRIAWDLRYMATTPVRVASNGGRGFGRGGMGPLVVPGTYHVSLDKVVDGVVSHLVDPVAFKVVPLNNATLAAQDKAALLAFQKQAGELMGRIRAAGAELSEAANRLRYIRAAIPLTPAAPDSLLAEARALQQRVDDLDIKLNGDRSVARRQFETPPSISQRISSVVYASYSATSAPGGAQKEQVRIAADEFQPVHAAIVKLLSDLDAFEARLKQMGAPYTPGQPPIQ
jgi:photosystem II stability/assembly factor-like uncharacterized protein